MFREHLLNALPVSELAPFFRDGFGRPSKDLHIALGALILQQLHDLTDKQASESIAFNITWRYALDIRHEQAASRFNSRPLGDSQSDTAGHFGRSEL